jgi:hypothetical protein
MANPSRRFAFLCLLLLSLANHLVLGKIRGVNPTAYHDVLSGTIDRKPASEELPHRLLKRNMHKMAKGGAKGGEELETEPPNPEHPETEFPTYSETLVPGHAKGGTKESGTKESGIKGGGIKGTVKGALQTVNNKVKGAKQSKDQGLNEVKTSQSGKDKGGSKSTKNEIPIVDNGGKSSKAKSSKYEGKAVEKKQQEYSSKKKSKDKLKKSADGKTLRMPASLFTPSGECS